MRGLLKRLVGRLQAHLLHSPPHYVYKRLEEVSTTSQIQQLALGLEYKRAVRTGQPLPSFDEAEFRAYSEGGEDGILWLLFSTLGTTSKTVVEICVGNGISSNSANLIVNHGWLGYLFEGDPERARAAERFYTSQPQTRHWPPVVRNAWIEPSNVNALMRDAAVPAEIDLLSLDMDGVDYWVLEALDAVRPRIIVLEFNNLWGPEDAVTVPNDPQFRAQYNSPFGADYSGASLAAFVKLCRRKEYRLVGAQRYGFNAFFVRNGLGEDLFPAVSPETCLGHPFAMHARVTRWPNVKDREWVRV